MLIRKVDRPPVDPSCFFIMAVQQCAASRREILEKLDADINSGMPVFPEIYGQALDQVFEIERTVFYLGGKIN